jgi:hypothetical protein
VLPVEERVMSYRGLLPESLELTSLMASALRVESVTWKGALVFSAQCTPFLERGRAPEEGVRLNLKTSGLPAAGGGEGGWSMRLACLGYQGGC